jgi:hypothetical protein
MYKPNLQIPPYTPSGCFIATAVYSKQSYKLKIFRKFRDKILLKNRIGKRFVKLYYKVSPRIANEIRERNFLRKVVLYLVVEPIYKLIDFFMLLYKS